MAGNLRKTREVIPPEPRDCSWESTTTCHTEVRTYQVFIPEKASSDQTAEVPNSDGVSENDGYVQTLYEEYLAKRDAFEKYLDTLEWDLSAFNPPDGLYHSGDSYLTKQAKARRFLETKYDGDPMGKLRFKALYRHTHNEEKVDRKIETLKTEFLDAKNKWVTAERQCVGKLTQAECKELVEGL